MLAICNEEATDASLINRSEFAIGHLIVLLILNITAIKSYLVFFLVSTAMLAMHLAHSQYLVYISLMAEDH